MVTGFSLYCFVIAVIPRTVCEAITNWHSKTCWALVQAHLFAFVAFCLQLLAGSLREVTHGA